jgi:hypothetical protein
MAVAVSIPTRPSEARRRLHPNEPDQIPSPSPPPSRRSSGQRTHRSTFAPGPWPRAEVRTLALGQRTERSAPSRRRRSTSAPGRDRRRVRHRGGRIQASMVSGRADPGERWRVPRRRRRPPRRQLLAGAGNDGDEALIVFSLFDFFNTGTMIAVVDFFCIVCAK